MTIDGLIGNPPRDQNFQNLSINDRINSCIGTFQRQLTIPLTVDVNTFPVRTRGSIVYDLMTDTIWYSDGIRWLPISAVSSRQILDTITIFVNAESGSDDNNGLTSQTAVNTIQTGINILGTFLAKNGVLQLEGNSAFDLGNNPSLDFFPATSFVGNIVVRGTQLDLIDDTVTSIPTPSGIGPFDTWTVINGTNGGYPISDYLSHFVHNTTQDRIYTVLDNGASSVDTITGNNAPNGLGDAWTIEDSFTLFKVQTILEFSGILSIINPTNSEVTFEYIWVLPEAGASWNNVVLPVTTFRGCRLDVNSERAYTGTMNIEGCYSKNVTPVETLFCPAEQDVCRRIDSFWLDGPSIVFSNTCSAIFMNCTNSIQENIFSFNISVESGEFQGFSIMISNSLSHTLMLCNQSTVYSLENIDFTNRTDVTFSVTLLGVGNTGPSLGHIRNAKLTNISTQQNSSCVNLLFGGKMHFAGSVDFTSTGHCVQANGGATITMFPSNIFSMVSTGTVRGPVSLDNGSEMSIRLSSGAPDTNFSTVNTLSRSFIQVLNGSKFIVLNASGSGMKLVTFSANNPRLFEISNYSTVILQNTNGLGFTITNSRVGGSLVSADHGSNYCDDAISIASTYSTNAGTTIDLETGSTATITQPLIDATAVTLVSCGNAAAVAGPGPYSTSINDYSAVPTQNCSITFG
jgi:hypothetical protein